MLETNFGIIPLGCIQSVQLFKPIFVRKTLKCKMEHVFGNIIYFILQFENFKCMWYSYKHYELLKTYKNVVFTLKLTPFTKRIFIKINIFFHAFKANYLKIDFLNSCSKTPIWEQTTDILRKFSKSLFWLFFFVFEGR